MQAEQAKHDKLTIGVLYGFRALMVLFVVNYHFWQQSWLGQCARVFGKLIDFDFFTRSSYLFVDGMILLSGFLLYLPYARQSAGGAPVRSAGRFYWNRLARILPSYLFSVLFALFFIALPSNAYPDAATRNIDVITHLTFTFTFFKETYLYTPLNGVLWTVAVEMQFYLIFPFVAKCVQRKPVITLCTFGALGVLFRTLMASGSADLSIWLNQLPTFLDVYALGILGAILFVKLTAKLQTLPEGHIARRGVTWSAPVLFAVGCMLLIALMRIQSENGLVGHEQLRLSQWAVRLPLAATLLLLMLSAALMPRFLQKLLDNRLMRFLSTISFNLYICHQMLSVQLARNLFPSTLHSDLPLQQAYTLLCYAASILVAMALTYGLEQPAARWMEKLAVHHQQNKETKKHEGSSDKEAMPATDSLLVRTEGGREGTD